MPEVQVDYDSAQMWLYCVRDEKSTGDRLQIDGIWLGNEGAAVVHGSAEEIEDAAVQMARDLSCSVAIVVKLFLEGEEISKEVLNVVKGGSHEAD